MRFRYWYLTLTFVLAAMLLFGVRTAAAQDSGDDSGGGNGSGDSGQCLMCHANSGAHVTFGTGDEISVQVDAQMLDQSVHGVNNPQGELSCQNCHGDYTYPHTGHTPPLNSPRDFRLALNQACTTCHTQEATLQADSVHAAAMQAGNENAPVCVDCHGFHDVTPPNQPRSKIPNTCGTCHTDVFNQYKDSVHGAALLEDSNPDVPTCIDCHGVHNIQDPTTNHFRLFSPQLCAKCHANKALMDKYGISTDVFNTYVSDFHGTTVTLFEKKSPDAAVNKAVCYDCHGVHNIRRPSDPLSTVYKDNLLTTCQKCHPDATANFPTAWLGHYEPDPQRYPLVYYVNLFYKYFIPGMIGFFLVVIIPDAIRRVINLTKKREGK